MDPRTPRTPPPARKPRRGFTLIELIVVLAIIALLASIVAPRYFNSVERAREATLRSSLVTMRDAIDKFAGDQGRYPESLDELVDKHYLRSLPVDPVTDSRETWTAVPPPEDSIYPGGMADVRSGAPGKGLDGSAYQDW